jgi:hypothetical protein
MHKLTFMDALDNLQHMYLIYSLFNLQRNYGLQRI